MPGGALIASCDDDPVLGRLAAHHVDAFSLFHAKGHAPDGGLRVFLDFCFCFFGSVPVTQEEAAVLYPFLKLFVVVALIDVCVPEGKCLLEDVLLDVVEKRLHVFHYSVDRNCVFLQGVTSHHLHRTVLKVFAAQYKSYGYALQLIVGKLEARALVVGIVILDADANRTEFLYDGSHLF